MWRGICSPEQRVLVAEVRLRYGAAAAAIREVGVVDETVLAARQQLGAVRARVEAGNAPPLEADLLEVEVRRLEAARLITVGRAEAAMAQLEREFQLEGTIVFEKKSKALLWLGEMLALR